MEATRIDLVRLLRQLDRAIIDEVQRTPQLLLALIGIKVNAAANVSTVDFKGLRRLKEHTGKDFIAGIVLYDGD